MNGNLPSFESFKNINRHLLTSILVDVIVKQWSVIVMPMEHPLTERPKPTTMQFVDFQPHLEQGD